MNIFTKKRFLSFLAFREAQDSMDLESHDKRFHPGGYKEGDDCKYREAMAKGDKADEGLSSGKTTLVTPEEDAAYMKAVEDGDMETASRMVREAAAKAMPNTKVVGADGLPLVVYHTTNTDFTVFDTPSYFADSRETTEEIKGVDSRRKTMAVFLDIKAPYEIDAEGASWKRIYVPEMGTMAINAIVEWKRRNGWKGYLPNDTIVDEDGIIVKNVMEGDAGTLKTNDYVPSHPSQIKSADPVTYDDDGKVIPLSRRFDSGDDIRGDVGGSKEVAQDSISKYLACVADESLEEHDAKYHPDGYKEGDSCKLREGMAKGDKSDEKLDEEKSLVTPEEDAAYMEAVNRGDMETASRMVREAASKWLEGSKTPDITWHTTKKKFTVFENNFPNVFFFAKDKKWATTFGNKMRYSNKDQTKPYHILIKNPLDMRTERTGNEWLAFFEQNGIKLGDKGRAKLEGSRNNNVPGWVILNHDLSEPYGTGYRDSMAKAGYDGAIFEDVAMGKSDRTTYGVFESNQIKSADPITYDDDGKVIPLSRRFDKGNDIRGAVGKPVKDTMDTADTHGTDTEGWIGFDLDGTLAKYDGWKGIDHIGEPIKPMVDKIKELHKQGKQVKIFTARVAPKLQADKVMRVDSIEVGEGKDKRKKYATDFIKEWCKEHLGFIPAITHEKDTAMIEMYDDRAKQVIPNTGILVEKKNQLKKYLSEH